MNTTPSSTLHSTSTTASNRPKLTLVFSPNPEYDHVPFARAGLDQKVAPSTLMPRPLAEGFARAIRADRALAGADAGTRRDYELRAARSEPGLEPSDTPELTRATGSESHR